MQISSALLRSLSSKGWDKPLGNASVPYRAVANRQQSSFTKEVTLTSEPRPTPLFATKRRPKAKRFNADAPIHSNQFVKATTTPLRDRRLSSTAKCLLLMVKALAGNKNTIELITKGQLAGTIGRSRRTVQYALSELQALGYLGLSTVKGYFGLYAGMRITIGMMTNPFSPTEFYQKAADQGEKNTEPSFSDRQIAALQITRFKYLEKKAAELRLQSWIIGEKNE